MTEAGEAVGVDPNLSPMELRDKSIGLKKMIQDWQMSYARTAARTALALVMSHHEDIAIWHVTKGMAEKDDEGNDIDAKAIWNNVAGYACRVADMAKYDEKFFEPVQPPPTPKDDDVADSEDEDDPERTPSASPSPPHNRDK